MTAPAPAAPPLHGSTPPPTWSSGSVSGTSGTDNGVVSAGTSQPAEPAGAGLIDQNSVAPTPETRASSPQPIPAYATHYGESYDGQTMGCPGAGAYRSDDASIVAVGPSRYREWPCGTRLEVCGAAGCAVVTRQDACPGCGRNVVDLSEAANRRVCGTPEHTCEVSIREVVE